MKKEFKPKFNQLSLLGVTSWLLMSGQVMANNFDIVPANDSTSTITQGESVFARCLITNRTETQCVIDCGNGEVINKRSGICKYNVPGTYTLVVNRIERRKTHTHTATVNVGQEGVYARLRKAPHQNGAGVVVNTPVVANHALPTNSESAQFKAPQRDISQNNLATPQSTPISSFDTGNALTESFSSSTTATINTSNQTSFTNSLSNGVQNTINNGFQNNQVNNSALQNQSGLTSR